MKWKGTFAFLTTLVVIGLACGLGCGRDKQPIDKPTAADEPQSAASPWASAVATDSKTLDARMEGIDDNSGSSD